MRRSSPLKPVVMIVDDDHPLLEVIDVGLGDTYHFILVTNPEEAVKQAETHHPSVIVLDIRMPKLSGFDLCKQLKSHKSFKQTPIIFLSAVGEETQLKAMNLGATAYVAKPFDLAELSKTLQQALQETT